MCICCQYLVIVSELELEDMIEHSVRSYSLNVYLLSISGYRLGELEFEDTIKRSVRLYLLNVYSAEIGICR